MTFAALYSIVIGAGMIGQWAFSLARKQVPELETEPIRIRFHLAAEFTTAIALLIGGLSLLTNSSWGLQFYLVSMGMLLYTVIVSPGYFAQRGQWPMVGVFAVVLVLGLISLGLVV